MPEQNQKLAANTGNVAELPVFGSSFLNEPGLIGYDLWRQLKRVTIPVFSGDERTYQNWKAAFMACIDKASATAEYKLLQL